MALLITLLLFGALLAAISYAGYRFYARPARFYEQLGSTVITAGSLGGTMAPKQEGVLVRTVRVIGQKVPISPQEVTLARRYLIAAGYRGDNAIHVYYGLKVVSCGGILLLTFLFANYLIQARMLQFLLIGGGALVGYFAPNWILDLMVHRRQETLRFSLPDALDLMVVCVEAGLGLDQAILTVSRELRMTHPEMCEELELVTLEMQAGKRRGEALRNLADRTGEEELRKLVAILIQTDRFGTSMADSLRTHSDYMRVRRRQQAEERANKVGVKLVFPIFFCILPAMFVVVAGPGVLQIIKQLFPLMREAGHAGM